ncbi:preQ(1) synthase [Elusimicrobiota bacterium]
MNDKEKLSILKQKNTQYPLKPENSELQVFDSPSDNDYMIEFETSEFTSLCPVTSQPDFARIVIKYKPDKQCIESKSLKLYLFSYRNYQGFAENIINRIMDDIVEISSPKEACVTGYFTARGGITLKVETVYNKERKI